MCEEYSLTYQLTNEKVIWKREQVYRECDMNKREEKKIYVKCNGRIIRPNIHTYEEEKVRGNE